LYSHCLQMEKLLNDKCDLSRFEAFKSIEVAEMTEVKGSLAKKSNIKDVCALLDMKSNIDDVNKAFEEMHSEVEMKLNKQDYEIAMGD